MTHDQGLNMLSESVTRRRARPRRHGDGRIAQARGPRGAPGDAEGGAPRPRGTPGPEPRSRPAPRGCAGSTGRCGAPAGFACRRGRVTGTGRHEVRHSQAACSKSCVPGVAPGCGLPCKMYCHIILICLRSLVGICVGSLAIGHDQTPGATQTQQS